MTVGTASGPSREIRKVTRVDNTWQLWLVLVLLLGLAYGLSRRIYRKVDRTVGRRNRRIKARQKRQLTVGNPKRVPANYRQTAIKVNEHPKGWTSYRQHNPDRYVEFRSVREGRYWIVYGKTRQGKWEIQTVRVKK